MSSKSIRSRRSRKSNDRPAKPYPEFPLYAHPLGYWSKKVRGKLHHFGRWGRVRGGKMVRLAGDGWQEALALYKAQVDDLQAGRTPRVTKDGDGPTVNRLCTQFYVAKERKFVAGEMTAQTLHEYDATNARIVAAFGKDRLVDDLAADDFAALRASLAAQFGPVRLVNEITRVRSVFKFGVANRLIDRLPVFGSEFVKPSKATLRKHRATGGEKMFTAEEVRRLLDGATVEGKVVPPASPQLRAMILLGINCAFGNHDVATLPKSALDLAGGWVTYARPKTGVGRRAALWPETVRAVREAMAPAGSLVFAIDHPRRTDAVTRPMGERLKALRINGRRRLGFYSARHTFRTVADAARDTPAVRLVMGHADGSIDDVYREHIGDDRLRAVADHVHEWLFPVLPEGGAA